MRASDRRAPINKVCDVDYIPVSHTGVDLTIARDPTFDFAHFDMKCWSFRPESTPVSAYTVTTPVVVMVFEWNHGWPHFMQDTLAALVEAKPFLDQNPGFKLMLATNEFLHIIPELLGIKNELLPMFTSPSLSFPGYAREYITFEPKGGGPANTVNNMRKPIYYAMVNTLIRTNLLQRFPELNKPVEPYILFLSRVGTPTRNVKNEDEILALDPRIKNFHLELTPMPLYDRLKLFYQASAVIAPHGGAIFHVLACKPGTRLVEIHNWDDYINIQHLARGMHLDYIPLTFEEFRHHQQPSYQVPLGLLRGALHGCLPTPSEVKNGTPAACIPGPTPDYERGGMGAGTAPSKIFVYSMAANLNWFGAGLCCLSEAMRYCDMKGWALEMDPEDSWQLVPGTRPNRTWSYYFVPRELSPEQSTWPRERMIIHKMTDRDPTWHPKTFDSVFAYKKALIRSIYKLQPWVREIVQKRKERLALPSPYYAVHIRRTDKVNDEGKFRALDDYLGPLFNHLASTGALVGRPTVYISSDEKRDKLAEEMKASVFADTFQFVIDDSERLWPNGFSPFMYGIIGRSVPAEVIEYPQEEVMTAFKNIELLTEAAFMVGSRESFFFVLAILLSDHPWQSLGANLKYGSLDGLLPDRTNS